MATYIIYSKNTGKILHTHTQGDGDTVNKKGILMQAEGKHDRADLDILEVDTSKIEEEKYYQVDTKTKKIKTGKGKGASAIANAGYASLEKIPHVDSSKFKFVTTKNVKQ